MFADEELAAFVRSGPFPDDVAAIRAGIEERAKTRARGPQMFAVSDMPLPGCPARLYRPTPADAPVVVYLHGGG